MSLLTTSTECSGQKAGISIHEQIRIILVSLMAHGEIRSMNIFYAALNRAMLPCKLSVNGKAALRVYLRRCVQDELVTRSTTGWTITSKGRTRAAQARVPAALPTGQPGPTKPRAGQPNATSKWLNEHMTPPRGQQSSKLHNMMRVALNRRLPVSAGADMVEDHIQTFMFRVIRRDSFARHIVDEKELPYSKVVAYCVNSGRSDVRNMGTDPVCRELYGARTEKERLNREEVVGPQPSEHIHDTDGNVVPPNLTTTIHYETEFEQLWGRIGDLVTTRKPHAWERYLGILEMKFRGYTTQEIADHEGVSRNRAASLLAEARQCVRVRLVNHPDITSRSKSSRSS